jgi:hypothetical protein
LRISWTWRQFRRFYHILIGGKEIKIVKSHFIGMNWKSYLVSCLEDWTSVLSDWMWPEYLAKYQDISWKSSLIDIYSTKIYWLWNEIDWKKSLPWFNGIFRESWRYWIVDEHWYKTVKIDWEDTSINWKEIEVPLYNSPFENEWINRVLWIIKVYKKWDKDFAEVIIGGKDWIPKYVVEIDCGKLRLIKVISQVKQNNDSIAEEIDKVSKDVISISDTENN